MIERRIEVKNMINQYGSKTNEEIVSLLDRIKPAIFENGIYSLEGDYLEKIKERPRNISFTFDPVLGEIINDATVFKMIDVLVISSSPFFLKPDVGEVFDQMNDEELAEAKFFYLDLDSFPPRGWGGDASHFDGKCYLCK